MQEPGQLVAELAGQPLGDRDQRVEVDAGLDALAVEQVDEVLGGDVAGRARRERAAAEAADGRVEDRRAVLEPGERVRVAGVARVVQVQADGRAGLQRRAAAARGPARGRRRRSCRRGSPRRAAAAMPVRVLDHQAGVDVGPRTGSRTRPTSVTVALTRRVRAATISSADARAPASTVVFWLRCANVSVTG